MNLSTRQLRAFLALAAQRSFTRAADQSHLSQPAFSELIRSLEQAVGARLFDRTTRHVELTPEGKRFEESARRLIGDFEGAVDDLRDHVARRKGRVSIAALPSLAAGWLPAVFAEFQALYPGIALDLIDTLSDVCLDLVRSGRADLALASTVASAAELSAEVFCTDRFHLVCRRDHPLARRRQVRLKELVAYPFVHLARSSSVRQHLDAAMHPLKTRTVLEVEHLATVTGMVEKGIGISVVPELTLFQFQNPNIVTRPLQSPGLTRDIYLVRRKDRSLSMAAQAMYELLLKRRPPLATGSGDRTLRRARARGRQRIRQDLQD